MFEELNEAEESPRSKIAQLTYENQNLKERLKVLTTESDERLKEFEECRRNQFFFMLTDNLLME